MKILKRIGIGLIVLLLLAQFYPRPERNKANTPEPKHIRSVYPIPGDVEALMKSSCYDCHSNNTVYPWYSNIQPVAWWLGDHIEEGKKELNFSEFANYSLARQYRKLEEVISEVKEGKMPLESYTFIHRNANFSAAQRQVITSWAENIRSEMTQKYPADSLIRKKK